ncbi:MAG: helix-turn-helix domain-containing protein, partial [Parcubacteria group bacterium]|nr:helix-turn-helix domain-containing protein [Parcubacteria group bacterium]
MPRDKDKNKYLPLSEAAELTPYSAEYLSLLARDGKLSAIKKGRQWVTTRAAVKEYTAAAKSAPRDASQPSRGRAGDDFISLAEAAKITGQYSGAYLKLRVNQNKLRAKKVGRNWYTKIEWIHEYGRGSAPKEKEATIPPLAPSGRAAWKASADNARFYPTRLLAAGLTATIAFLFVAPPQVWAHWGVSASLAVTASFGLATDGSRQLASSLSADSRFSEPMEQVMAAVKFAASSLGRVTRQQGVVAERLASRFGLDVAPRSSPIVSFRGEAEESLGRAAGQVAGAF